MISTKVTLLWTGAAFAVLVVHVFWFVFWAAGQANTPRPSPAMLAAGYVPLGVCVLVCGWAIRLWLLWARQ
jgi:hypothetical protein